MQPDTIAILDFDDTLVEGDTFKLWITRERLWLDPVIFFYSLLWVPMRLMLLRSQQLGFRSKVKRRLLEIIQKLPPEKRAEHVHFMRSRLKQSVITEIKNKSYAKLYIASASETSFIKDVIKNVLEVEQIVACNWPKKGEPFKSCWGPEKVARLKQLGILPSTNAHVYSDSLDDIPLMLASSKFFLVQGNDINEFKKK